MRTIITAVFVAALVAASAQSKAAPRSINDCEKIQAADAYNQCLALFGPVARGHGGGDGVAAGRQDAEAATGNVHTEALATAEMHHGRHHASRHGFTRHRWAKHGGTHHGWARRNWTRHSLARRGHWHGTGAAGHRHGKTTSVAFSITPAATRLR